MKDQIHERELFENTPVLKAILRLALPTAIGQIILVIYNMADTFFIGMTGSTVMVTAVTICMPAFMFLSAISNLFGIGGASVISRSLGAGKPERARYTASFAFWGCIAVSLLYQLGVWLLMDPFIDALGGSNELVHAQARQYLIATVGFGGVFAAMSTFLSHLVRCEGRSVHASVGIALGGVLNILLDPLFMFVILPKGQEVLGAAIATALSNLISMLYLAAVIRAHRSQSVLRLGFARQMFQDGIPGAVLSCGLPACLMTLCENISYAVLDNLMALNGVAMQAGVGIAKKINMLAHCIVRGISQGVLPLISYNFASGNHQRMKDVATKSMCISVGVALCCMGVCLGWHDALVSLFIRDNAKTIHYGASFLSILCIGAPFSACAYAIISFFQAVGCGLKSFVLAILRKGILDIPLMFILQKLLPVYGIVWATPAADILCSSAAMCLFVGFMLQLLRRDEAANAISPERSLKNAGSQAVFSAGRE